MLLSDAIPDSKPFRSKVPAPLGAEGWDDGEPCGRGKCKGILKVEEPEGGCSCHINPPCASCTNVRLYCPTCDWISDPNEDPITPEHALGDQEHYDAYRKRNPIVPTACDCDTRCPEVCKDCKLACSLAGAKDTTNQNAYDTWWSMQKSWSDQEFQRLYMNEPFPVEPRDHSPAHLRPDALIHKDYMGPIGAVVVGDISAGNLYMYADWWDACVGKSVPKPTGIHDSIMFDESKVGQMGFTTLVWQQLLKYEAKRIAEKKKEQK